MASNASSPRMPSCSKHSARLQRARPLLGTFVEIRATAPNAPRAELALRAAFAAVARVHSLMSYHDPLSDVSRLNRTGAFCPVQVDSWTHLVLRSAIELHTASQGLFDIATAPALIRNGWLPPDHTPLSTSLGCTTDIELLTGHRVRFRRPLRIDLGGIAKGFAVDRAVAALRRHGATAGIVNAGGDLRTFGPIHEPIHVRCLESPGNFLHLTDLKNFAVATSAPYFATRRIGRRLCAPIIDPRDGRPSSRLLSVSVQARTCLLADALCKVVWLVGADAATPVLRRYRAKALVLQTRHALIQRFPSRHAA